MPANKKFLIILCVIGLILFSINTIFFFSRAIKPKVLPVYGTVENFELMDINAQKFGLKNLENKIWVVDFMFTTCSGICPVMTKNMAALHRSFKLEDDIALVSISVNPENDTPQVLSEFAKKYSADTNKWHFLTGSREDIQKMAIHSFKMGSVDEPIFHSAKFVLVDKFKQIRGFYDGTVTEEVQNLFKDSAQLIKEK